MERTALILGATGGIGGEIARALIADGWQIRALARTPRPDMLPIDWRQGDAMDREAVVAAATGADAIVHAVNPPGYRDWGQLVLPMIDNSIAAACAANARLLLPGTIYNFDPAATPIATPDSPQQPKTRKGAIRVEMERRIASACEGGMRAAIVRAGDYFGPRAGNSWLSQGMVRPGQLVKSVLYPGAPGVGHAWAYLPDVAATFAMLLGREAQLPAFARFHFAGYWDAGGRDMVDAIGAAAGIPNIRARRLPWRLLPLIAPFNPTMREMIEMEAYWRHPVALDNCSLVAAIGAEPHTPLVEALRTTLGALDCLPVEKSAAIA